MAAFASASEDERREVLHCRCLNLLETEQVECLAYCIEDVVSAGHLYW